MASLPAYRSTAVLQPGYRAATRARAVPRVNILAASVVFLGLTYAFFSAASLAASVMAEQARQQSIRSAARLKLAQNSELALAARVDELQGLKRVDTWAAGNGFIAPVRISNPSETRKDGRSRP